MIYCALSLPVVMRRLSGNRRGAIAVEFALISPILILMLTGIVNYGSYFWTSHALQQMANDAARVAISGTTESERAALAQAVFDQQSGHYDLTIPGQTELRVAEDAQTITVQVSFVPTSGQGFNLMGTLPGMPSTIERTASIVRGGY